MAVVPLFVAVAGPSASIPASQDVSASRPTPREIVRDRLERSAAGSRSLFDRAARGDRYIASLGLAHVIREDEPGLGRGRFPRRRDVREYWRLRPWETAYRWLGSAPVPIVATEDWPTRADAPALRELLSDESGSLRGLAVEALGALGLPEDIRRIGALLTDKAVAVPALARTSQRSSMSGYIRPGDEDALVPLVWSDRTVGAYARAAVLLMTGHHFDGTEIVSFPEWIELHDLGEESLWYWRRRLSRESFEVRGFIRSPGEEATYQAQLRRRLSDLSQLSKEAQAKVFLLTEVQGDESWIGPVNPHFPDFTLTLGRERILELLDGRNIWRDCLDEPGVKQSLMWRIARLAPEVLPAADWPHVRKVLQTRAPNNPRTPVVVSRLLPAAASGQADDPQTREGHLRATLGQSTSEPRLRLVAAEMVRKNLTVHWPVLAARFNADPAVGREERLGVLDGLREQPRSREKLAVLVAFLDSPRNGPLLALSGDHLARYSTIWTLIEYAGGTPSVPMRLFDDFRNPDRSGEALIELRRVGHAVLDRWTAAKELAEGPDGARVIDAVAATVDDGRRSSPSQTAAQGESASSVAARQAARDRLERAVAGSRELFARAPPGDRAPFGDQVQPYIPEDGPAVRRGQFSTLAEVREYWRFRPWDRAYTALSDGPILSAVTWVWPTRVDAAALRDLISDNDPAIRALAVEALGALGLPEDIRRIGRLLTDTAAAAPALARIHERADTTPYWHAMEITGSYAYANPKAPPLDDRADMPMVWSDRTVSAYARAAVRLLTRRSFDNLGFLEWSETHDLGWDSFWYWETRLLRELHAVAVIEPTPTLEFARHRNEATEQFQAELRTQTAADLDGLLADAQAKIYLLTDIGIQWDWVTGPVNKWFPDDFTLRIGRERILELLDGHNIWRDCLGSYAEGYAEAVLLWRLGRLAPTLLPEADWPHVRDQLQTRAAHRPGMPVLVSRLLPAAGIGQADDPRTREGFLRLSLARAVNDLRLQLIAMEMVRTNVVVQWPFLAARFNTNPDVGRLERLGVLAALAEAPHTAEKLEALVAFVDDPRNAALLTDRRQGGLPDRPRNHAVEALAAFSPARRAILYQLQQDLGTRSRQDAALVELRRLAHRLLTETRDPR